MALMQSRVELSVMPVDLHNLEESPHFFFVRLLINVDDIVKGQDSCTDALHFIKQLRQLDLDRHEKDWHSIGEIELGRTELQRSLQHFHDSVLSNRDLSWRHLNRCIVVALS